MLTKYQYKTNQLKKVIGKLESQLKRTEIDADKLEALAEAYFRLAVSPGTPGAKAITYLKRANKIDGANPKYAYHTARLYYRHGDLENASHWLKNAVFYAPTSHRIWAHISFLQKVLYKEKYKGNHEYKYDELKKWANNITSKIKEGEDHFEKQWIKFTPPLNEEKDNNEISPEEKNFQVLTGTKRFKDAGKCRWSGIWDLEIEDILTTPPSRDNFKEIEKAVKDIKKHVRKRIYASSSLAAIGIQCLVAGYPPKAIKTMLEDGHPGMDDCAIKLLEELYLIIESDLNKLPEQLADALNNKRIPPLVATLIHQSRLLSWRPLTFKGLKHLRSAREFLWTCGPPPHTENDPQRQKLADEYIGKLKTALDNLTSQPPPFPDLGGSAPHPAEKSVDNLNGFKQKAEKVGTQLDDLWLPLKKLQQAYKSGSFTEEDRQKGLEMFNFVEMMFYQFIEDIKAVDHVAPTTVNPEKEGGEGGLVRPESEKIKDLLKMHKETCGAIRKKLKKLPLMNLEDAKDSNEIRGEEGENKEKYEGIDEVQRLVEGIERKIGQLVDDTLGSFGHYSPSDKKNPALQELYIMTMGQAAELLYRVGKRQNARELWNRILTIDRLNLNALKNIAVHDSLHRDDIALTLFSWKAYCEMLYYHAIFWQDPYSHLEKRVEFHRSFSTSYAPAFSRYETGKMKDKDTKIQELDFIELINRPGQLREFITHKFAEYFNRKLDYTTPTLVLGVERNVHQETRKQARDGLMDFARSICATLPRRVSDGFLNTCTAFINKAFELSQTPDRLVVSKNKNYYQEEKKHIHWIQDIYRLKKYFYLTFYSSKFQIVKQVRYIDFIFILDELGNIPVSASKKYLESAVTSLNIMGEPSEVISMLDSFIQTTAIHLLAFIVFNDDELQTERVFSLFKQVAVSLETQHLFWHKLKEVDPENFEKLFDVIDDASRFYPPEMLDTLQEEGNLSQGIFLLKEWAQMFPALTGPARTLFILAIKTDKPEEGLPYLEKAAKKGFLAKGREECEKILNDFFGARPDILVEPYLAKGQFEKALDVMREKIEEKPDNSNFIGIVLKIYQQWLDKKSKPQKTIIAKLEKDVDYWKELVGDQLQGSQIKQIVSNAQYLVVSASIAHLGKLDITEKFKETNTIMERLLKKDPQNLHATFYLMIGKFQLAARQSKNGERPANRKDFEQVRNLANQIIKDSGNDDYIKQAQNIIDQLAGAGF
jgi:hypothetical protein